MMPGRCAAASPASRTRPACASSAARLSPRACIKVAASPGSSVLPSLARASARRTALSGGVGEGDGESERFELADVVAGFFVFVGAAGVIAGAEFAEAGGAAGEQVPDDHQDGAGDGDQGFELAAAAGDPPVALAEEGAGAGGRGGGLAEDGLETSDAVKLSSCFGVRRRCGCGEGGLFVVVLAGGQAVVEAAEQPSEQVALGGRVPVAVGFAPVVVGAGAG